MTQFVPIAVSSFHVANQQDRMQVISEGVATTISIALVAFNRLTVILYVVAAWQCRGEAVGALKAMRFGFVNRCCRRRRQHRRRDSTLQTTAAAASSFDHGGSEAPP